MTPYRKQGKLTYTVFVPTPSGGVKRSTGTRDRATAVAMQRMLQELGPQGKRRWDLLAPVADGRLRLAQLYDAYVARDLDGLLARLDDLDLRPLIPQWQAWVAVRVRSETAARYARHLATLVPADEHAPWPRSSLTRSTVARWLATRGVAGPTQRKYAAALASFVTWGLEQGHLTTDPLATLTLPPPSAPQSDFLERDEVDRLVEGSPAPWCHLWAFLYGTGSDVTPALAVRRRHVDLGDWLVRVPGTKTGNRDRVAIIAEWARPWVAAACRDLLPDAPLFPMDRWQASTAHREQLKALKIRHLKLHAARNHWAVRALRGGWSVEAVARQLGNTPAMVLRVYGRWVLSTEELQRLETAAEREALRRAAEGARFA